MEASAILSTLATPASRATEKTRLGACHPVPLARRQRLLPVAPAARRASIGALFHRKARQGLPEALGPVRVSPELSWARRRARRASDRTDGPCSDGQTRQRPAHGQESGQQPTSAAERRDVSTVPQRQFSVRAGQAPASRPPIRQRSTSQPAASRPRASSDDAPHARSTTPSPHHEIRPYWSPIRSEEHTSELQSHGLI